LPGGWIINFPGFSGDPIAEAELGRRLRLPRGFSVATYASGIPNARMLRVTERGDVLVSAPREGKVFLIPPGPEPAAGGTPAVLLDGLDAPHGLALHDGWLFVAETGAILRVRFDAATRRTDGDPERIVTGLPAGGRHWTRTIGIGPDGWLYLSVGSSCNVCIEKDLRRAAISRYRLDGSGEQLYATGLRNAVGFAWQPASGDLYATDNGRDLLGDDFPPCELNRIVEGGFYGWPFANGTRLPDPDYGKGNADRIAASIAPIFELEAHTAPLGVAFYDGTMFPERYRGAAFVALHGSWNRSEKSGYKVVALFFDSGKVSAEDFLVGFERENDVIGRPVDVAPMPDGALLVSDDYTGSIYRIAYGESTRSTAIPTRPARVGDPLAAIPANERQAASERGAQLWQSHECAKCHAPGADPSFRPLTGLAAKYDLAGLTHYLLVPQPPMPVFPLSESQRRDLAIHLLTVYGHVSSN
jgi:glucose/arabinose dehydrogenase